MNVQACFGTTMDDGDGDGGKENNNDGKENNIKEKEKKLIIYIYFSLFLLVKIYFVLGKDRIASFFLLFGKQVFVIFSLLVGNVNNITLFLPIIWCFR